MAGYWVDKVSAADSFFGENSAGKSSLGQLLLALKQSAGSAAAQPSLNFGDGQSLIDLGSFAQNLHGGQLTEPLQLYVQGRSVVMLGMVKRLQVWGALARLRSCRAGC